jgi:hypothetical protein
MVIITRGSDIAARGGGASPPLASSLLGKCHTQY